VLNEAANHEVLPESNGASLVVLTPRELEVLDVISAGLTNAQAAQRMHLSVHAIKFHLAAIYRRLGVANRTEAVVAYLRLMNGGFDARPPRD
jgi:DNA-binding NarL/FixJ family response regulator